MIGILSSSSWDIDNARRLPPFRQGLSEAGYAEGRNVTIEYRGAENQLDRLPALAADLVRRHVSLIKTSGSPVAALAAKSATTTIPIVFVNAADPVRIGLVASLSHPGGNVTGVTELSSELGVKRLGLLRELVPSATSIAILVNPKRPDADIQSAQLREAAQSLGLKFHTLKAGSEHDFDAAFQAVVQSQASGALFSVFQGNGPFSGSVIQANMGFSGGTFTGNFLNFQQVGVTKFNVDSGGNLAAVSYGIQGGSSGVSCSGAPAINVNTFVSVNGIVTHC